MAKLSPSFKFNESQIEQLKQIVPEAFKDGMLDFGALYDALQDYTDEETDADDNFYGLYWPGKKEAKRAASVPPRGTLIPVGDGVDEDSTRNLYIEGDNLEVLKLLQKAYAGRIKMIYIDPPYNTGNDFIYNDDFSETVEAWQQESGQVDASGTRLTTNSRNDGRFHSRWMSMMYPRLRLARSLLSEDGILCISIGEEEVSTLKMLCNDVFGEANFRNALFTKRYDKNINRQFMEDGLISMNVGLEYILIYSLNPYFKFNPVFRKATEERATNGYWKGFWNDANRPTMRYEILGVKPETGQWKWKSEVAQEAVNNYKEFKDRFSQKMSLEEYWIKNGKNKKFIRRKADGNGKNKGIEHWIPPAEGILRNTNWSDLLASKPIGLDLPFDNPKNIEVLTTLVKLSNVDEEGLVLDFFSGSATTAHAVMQLNAEDGGNRQFIMVQLPETCEEKSEAFKAGFKNICEIGKERIRRAGKKIKQDAGLNAKNLDIGFKVFRLAPSNYKKWSNYTGTDIKEAEATFESFENPLIEGWKPENLLTEIMLIEGFPLDSVITGLDVFKKNKIQKISSDFCDHSLFVCLDREISADTIKNLTLEDNDIFICLDSAISDQDKARLDDKGLIKTI